MLECATVSTTPQKIEMRFCIGRQTPPSQTEKRLKAPETNLSEISVLQICCSDSVEKSPPHRTIRNNSNPQLSAHLPGVKPTSPNSLVKNTLQTVLLRSAVPNFAELKYSVQKCTLESTSYLQVGTISSSMSRVHRDHSI